MFEVFSNKFLGVFLVAVLLLWSSAGRAEPADPVTVWEGVAGAARVEPGKPFTVRVRLRNTGSALWKAGGAGRVLVASMVVDGNGNPWPAPEARARLAYPAPPGAATTCLLTVSAPTIPGRYRLLMGRGEAGRDGLKLDASSFAWAFEVVAAKP